MNDQSSTPSAYKLLESGDTRAVEFSTLEGILPEAVSENDLENTRYQFVASLTLACRSAVLGGADAGEAEAVFKKYLRLIREAERCETLLKLHREMFGEYLKLIKSAPESLLIRKSVDYISKNLNTKLRIEDIAGFLGINPSYLSTRFKAETGKTLSKFISELKIKTAENMLKSSEYSYREISESLAYSSQSYFTQSFKQATGLTPKKYRDKYCSVNGVDPF